MFDKNNSGYMKDYHIRRVTEKLGQKLSMEHIRSIIKKFSASGTYITKEELSSLHSFLRSLIGTFYATIFRIKMSKYAPRYTQVCNNSSKLCLFATLGWLPCCVVIVRVHAK